MFIVAREHLKAVAAGIGIPQITFAPQSHGGGRRCDIFTIPNRGRLNQPLKQPRDLVGRWRDPLDLNSANQPKIKERPIKAEQRITLRVVLTNLTIPKVNIDFKNFVRNLGKEIYDGILLNGTHNGSAGVAILEDTTTDFIDLQVEAGSTKVYNVTDGSAGIVSAVAEHKITATLEGGTNDDWQVGDTYKLQTEANYIAPNGDTVKDTKGNLIKIILGNYDYNDNKFYGDIISRVVMDIEFSGGVFMPDADPSTILIPAEWTTPVVASVDNAS